MPSLVSVIPLAFVMVAGPQIASAIFLATTEKWRANSVAFVAGATLSITLVVLAAFVITSAVTGTGSSSTEESNSTAVDWIIVALLVLLAIRTYLKRHETKPPKWMGRLAAAEPPFAFKLGFLLLGVFPTDILTSVTVGSTLARGDDPLWYAAPFLAVTLAILAMPVLLVLALGKRAGDYLPKVRDWMNTNSWVVSEIVIVFFLAVTLSGMSG